METGALMGRDRYGPRPYGPRPYGYPHRATENNSSAGSDQLDCSSCYWLCNAALSTNVQIECGLKIALRPRTKGYVF